MASDYGLNFGFRVSDETRRISNGQLRTPASGAALLLGTLVEQDGTTGFLKVAAANAVVKPGVCGLLVQEEIWDRTIYEAENIDSFYLGVARLNRLSVVTSGAGVKVWFKNTAAQTRADGRVINAVTMFDGTNVAVGRGLVWDGAKYVDVADPTTAASIGTVTAYDASKGLVTVSLKA